MDTLYTCIFPAWGTLIGNGHDIPADPSHWRREDDVPTAEYNNIILQQLFS